MFIKIVCDTYELFVQSDEIASVLIKRNDPQSTSITSIQIVFKDESFKRVEGRYAQKTYENLEKILNNVIGD